MWSWKPKEPPKAGTKEAREQGCTCERLQQTGRNVRCAGLHGSVVGFPETVYRIESDPHCPVHGAVARKLVLLERQIRWALFMLVMLTAYLVGKVLAVYQ
jgi:hypothetical protein